MDKTLHPVTLDRDLCTGCTTCVKRCPTEAIRVRNKHAIILHDRCIVCSECIRLCPAHAKKAQVDKLADALAAHPYTVALVPPVLYAQFSGLRDRNIALTALLQLGFHAVFEVAEAAEAISAATQEAYQSGALDTPLISSSCPTVRRIIRARFPSLLSSLLPFHSPMELAARAARQRAAEATGLPPGDIGCVYLSPCPAAAAEMCDPLCCDSSAVSAVVSIAELYPRLLTQIKKVTQPQILATASPRGIGWGVSGGESRASFEHVAYLAGDGMENILQTLENVENQQFSTVKFYEFSPCTAGCVGGALTVENPFIARTRLSRIMAHPTELVPHAPIDPALLRWERHMAPAPVLRLGGSIADAMAKLRRIQEQENRFIGMDCGACGAPSCHALAEDIVEGMANEDQCIFLMREKLQKRLYGRQSDL